MTKKTGPARPNLSAVAAHAGVSTATASKVVNGRPDVAEDTRERVETAITALGYRGPSRTTTAHTVELMVDTLDTTYASQILRGVVLAAERLGRAGPVFFVKAASSSRPFYRLIPKSTRPVC